MAWICRFFSSLNNLDRLSRVEAFAKELLEEEDDEGEEEDSDDIGAELAVPAIVFCRPSREQGRRNEDSNMAEFIYFFFFHPTGSQLSGIYFIYFICLFGAMPSREYSFYPAKCSMLC